MKYKIKGFAETREVFMNNSQLNPRSSQRVVNHSPDGFNWGYAGSGPAQLALAILMRGCEDKSFPIEVALRNYQKFKTDHLVKLAIDQDFGLEVDLEEYLK